MLYFNYAGLGREELASRTETRIVQDSFEQVLFSEAGVRWYSNQVEKCQRVVQRMLGISGSDSHANIIFVPNATTAFQIILSEVDLQKGDAVVTSKQEHPAIIRPLLRLREKGIELKVIDADSEGEFCEKLTDLASKYEVRMLVISHVSHTDGRIFPLRRISEITKQQNMIMAIDGAQAVGHLPIDLQNVAADFYFFSGHKWCCGPMGTGALFVSQKYLERNTRIKLSLSEMGSVQKYFDLGTQHIGLISGLAKACEMRIENLPSLTKHLLKLQDQFRELASHLKGAHLSIWNGEHAPGICTLRLEGANLSRPNLIADHLQQNYGIAVKPFNYPELPGQLRISYLRETSESDIQKLVDCLIDTPLGLR